MSDSDMAGTSTAVEDIGSQLAGKYLTCELGHEVYALEILKVREIIGIMQVTRVPRTPAFVRGVINLRGKVIPVIDLRLKFGFDSQEDTDKTCIVVVQVASPSGPVIMGIVVDQVSEVLDISADQVEPPPSFGATVDTDFILGMGKVGEQVVTILGIDKLLSVEEASSVAAAAPAEQEQHQEEQNG